MPFDSGLMTHQVKHSQQTKESLCIQRINATLPELAKEVNPIINPLCLTP